jgi:hypothetical protein
MRAETGTMRFAEDWRGVFIRGDNAFGYAMYLKSVLAGDPAAEAYKHGLQGLLDLLLSSDERNANIETQNMKTFAECMSTPSTSAKV